MKNKGQTIILVAGITLGFLLVFAVLAIDFSRMYYVRGQLQNAADSAALAGADMLNDTSSTIQQAARDEAIIFAAKNSAANSAVVLASVNGSNTLGAGNDITVGNWNSTTRVYTPNTTPVNAVQVRARRTTDSPGGTVPFLFPKIIPGLSNMGVTRVAIATRPPLATSYVALGSTACTSAGSCNYPTFCTLTPPRQLQASPPTLPANEFGWTTLLERPGSASATSDLMCNNSPGEQICGSAGIWGIPGAGNSVLQDYESLMFDPNFDKSNKEINALGIVTGWLVMVPRTTAPDPMSGPDPDPVSGYTFMRIIAVCASGTNGCTGTAHHAYGSPPGLCGPSGTYPDGTIVIDRISCINCGDPALGIKNASLVK